MYTPKDHGHQYPGVLDEYNSRFHLALLLATARRVVEADQYLRSLNGIDGVDGFSGI